MDRKALSEMASQRQRKLLAAVSLVSLVVPFCVFMSSSIRTDPDCRG